MSIYCYSACPNFDIRHTSQTQMLTWFLPSIMKGGLLGFLTILATSLALVVGLMGLCIFKEPNPSPLSMIGCKKELNALSSSSSSSSSDYPFSFFYISYLYFTPACLIVGIVVSLVTVKFSFCVLLHRSQFPLSNRWK